MPGMMPEWIRDILAWNPVLHAVDWFRASFFQEYEPVNGQDAWQGQFRAKLGLKQKFPEAFAYCYDLSKITA